MVCPCCNLAGNDQSGSPSDGQAAGRMDGAFDGLLVLSVHKAPHKLARQPCFGMIGLGLRESSRESWRGRKFFEDFEPTADESGRL
jgi:hypothetical protein